MQDLLLATVVAGSLLLLVVLVTSAMVAQYSEAKVPGILAGRQYRRGSRRSLIITLPWVIAILGGGQVVMGLFILHPASSTVVRVVAGLELVGAGLWIGYLFKLVSRRA